MVQTLPAVQQESPLDLVLSCLPNARSSFRGYTASCPGPVHARGDRNPSLEIWEDDNGDCGLKCYGGCERKEICNALGIEESALYRKGKDFKPKAPRKRIDMLDLALDKSIPTSVLFNLGLLEIKTGGIHIPYFNLDGTEYTHARVRTELKAKDGTKWEKGAKALPYGLDRLAATDHLAIVEGESDCWTLWMYGLPALGIPGASSFNCIAAEHVAVFPPKVYISQEPDTAGKRFLSKIAGRLAELNYQGEVFAINLKVSHGVKDPNDLHKKLCEEKRLLSFKDEWRKALDAAVKIDIQEGDKLPEIIIGGQLREQTAETLAALARAEEKDPHLFVQSGINRLVRVARDKKKKPIVLEMGVNGLKNALSNSANFFRLKAGEEGTLIPKSPPKELAEAILALDPESWPFPSLETIVETPIIRPDGSILDKPGYDEKTHLYYMPQEGLDIPRIPHAPTREEAKRAAKYLSGFIQDFPFDSDASRANATGAAMTTITRQMFKHVPMGLVDANKQGTGKGLLTDFLSILAMGKEASALSPAGNDEELDKRFTACLLEGDTFIVIDNQEGVLRSPVLAKILTSTYHKGRMLGASKMIDVPQRAMWIANGNNIQLGGDMARRCYRIRMLSEVSNPDAREGFKYPHLKKTAMEERGKIIAAMLTIARAWFVAGCPAPEQKMHKLATFTEWSDATGGMLNFAGIDGFLANNDDLRKEADVDGGAWTLFLTTWIQKFESRALKTADLIDELNKDKNFAETLPEPLGSQFLKEDKSFSRKLGRILAKQNGTPYGPDNLKIEKGEDTHSKVATFKVAGYAGYAGLKSPHTHTENFESKSLESKGFSHSENSYRVGENHIPHTPHTPQDELAACQIADTNTPLNYEAAILLINEIQAAHQDIELDTEHPNSILIRGCDQQRWIPKVSALKAELLELLRG